MGTTSEASVDCQMMRTVEPTCVVCWNTKRDPALCCMHRVCWDCLQKLDRLECPTCRAHINLRDFVRIKKYNETRWPIRDYSGSETSDSSGSDSDFELTSEDESESEEESNQSEDEND